MAGNGPPPKLPSTRHRTAVPTRGEWQVAPGDRWMHGEVPPPPEGITEATRDAWECWFSSWPASFWSPDDLPQITAYALVYDGLQRGELQRSAEVRLWADTLGLTQKGRQSLRWSPPGGVPEPPAEGEHKPRSRHYAHLRVVGGEAIEGDR